MNLVFIQQYFTFLLQVQVVDFFLRSWIPGFDSGTDRDHHLARWFDPVWYNATYALESESLNGFQHYLLKGVSAGNSPNESFDEEFYRSFYCDVREAIEQGDFLCGFEHFVLFGEAEGRLPRHEIGAATEAVFPGLTRPVEIDTADSIEDRIRPLPARSSSGPRTAWFLLPLFNPDIFFGGYKAVLELMLAFFREGWAIKIVICSHPTDTGVYALWKLKGDRRFSALATSSEVLNRLNLSDALAVSPHDRFIAYSCWEAYQARELVKLTNQPRFIFLVQEYEPVFHEYGSEHAIVSAAYDFEHFPLFNSKVLADYFRAKRIGIFSKCLPEPGRDYSVFEQVLTSVLPSLTEMRDRFPLRFAMYARPEVHAKRNLFAVGVIALREAVARGYFRGSWEFFGMGSAQPGSVDLLGQQSLTLLPKMDAASYANFTRSVDVGLSLIYAPHPGVVAYELASAGTRVVTNEFENRSAPALRAISGNIVPCAPTIEGIASGLREAIAGVGDYEKRLEGAAFACRGRSSQWDDVFDRRFFLTQLRGVLD